MTEDLQLRLSFVGMSRGIRNPGQGGEVVSEFLRVCVPVFPHLLHVRALPRACLCVYTYICVCLYARLYINIYTHVYTLVCTHVLTHIHMSLRLSTHMSKCLLICMDMLLVMLMCIDIGHARQ